MKHLSVSLPTEIPITDKADVIVVGGGPGGISASVAAAREGCDVALFEHYGFLGGMATAGEVNPFMSNHINGESLDKGVYTEWVSRIKKYGGLGENGRIFDPFAARFAAEDLCLEAGVRLRYHHRSAHVETENRKISGIVMHSKSGLSAAVADVYIDSTGDADIAAQAGCESEYGGEGTPYVQPMTLSFKVILDADAIKDYPPVSGNVKNWFRDEFEHIQKLYRTAQADGRISNPRENVLMFRAVAENVIHFNTTRVIKKSAINGTELSDAEIEARSQIRNLFALLSAEIPLFKNSRICSIGTQIGVRESRRIKGIRTITREDFNNCATFKDGITRVNYPIDVHSPTGAGTEICDLPDGKWYEIPYGCLVPKDIDNLLIGCRAISVDHGVHSSARVMPPVCSIGQAAGVAASLAQKNNTNVCDLNGCDVKMRLIETGRNLV